MKHPLLQFYFDNRKYWASLFIVVVFAMFSGIFTTFAANMWGMAVDYGLDGKIKPMLAATVGMAVFVLLDSIRTNIHYWIIGHVTEGMFFDLRVKVFRKIAKGNVAILKEKFRTGDLTTRINSDIDNLNKFVAGDFADYTRRIFKAAFAVVSCILLSWQLSLAYCIILPTSIWLVNCISKPIQSQSKKRMDNNGKAMSIAGDAVSGILTVKAFGIEDVVAKPFDSALDAAYEQDVKSERIVMRLTAIKYAVSVLQTMSLFLLGSVLVTNNVLAVGDFLAFISLSVYISDMTERIDRMLSSIRKAGAIAQRLYEVLDIPDEQPGSVYEKSSDIPCIAEKVTFSYTDNTPALNDITIKIGKNQKVAIVGASGSGKSTILNLICRFYPIDSGRLIIFGNDVSDWDAEALRHNISLVPQDSMLFEGSIYENIAYGRKDLTRKECECVLKQVGLWEFVSSFPEGIDHKIGELGFQLSEGQKQRLSIARAMVKQAPMVLLDEPTSALDTSTEKEVQKALDKLLQGRSAIIIAHRLSTIQNADYIYYMEHGVVLEEGTPSKLLSQKGKYYDMCLLQGLIGRMDL